MEGRTIRGEGPAGTLPAQHTSCSMVAATCCPQLPTASPSILCPVFGGPCSCWVSSCLRVVSPAGGSPSAVKNYATPLHHLLPLNAVSAAHSLQE